MNTIKHGIITLFVSFAVFFFMPVVSFASESESYQALPIEYSIIESALESKNWYSKNRNYNIYGAKVSWYNSESASSRTEYPDYPVNTIFSGYTRACLFADPVILNNYGYKAYRFAYWSPSYSYPQYIAGGNQGFVGFYNNENTTYVSIETNMPLFTINSTSDITTPGTPIYEWLKNGNLSDTDNVIGYGVDAPIDSKSLGYIKPSYYLDNHVGSSGSYEIITWSATSTTGVDLTDSRYNVQFALRDKSYTMSAGEKAKINFDTYPNMVEGIGVYLGRKIYNYSHDNVNNAILRGDAVPMSTYNNMVSLGITSASSRRFAFNAMNEYSRSPNFQAAHPEIAANLNNVINANIQEFIPGGFLQRVFNDSNLRNLADFQLSYDIYARISDSQSGTKGNWLLIDKHGRPVKDLENALNGGSTIRPVKVPDFEPSSDFTLAPDDEDIPDEELDDNDTVKDEPLPTGYIDPSSGDGVNNYYNYTYNYDNRTWIENHYDNQTVEEVNEGLEWIKMFPGFFGLFLKFFGAFLPGWAVVCVTIAIPIIIGLLIFKAIKGVIPFV